MMTSENTVRFVKALHSYKGLHNDEVLMIQFKMNVLTLYTNNSI